MSNLYHPKRSPSRFFEDQRTIREGNRLDLPIMRRLTLPLKLRDRGPFDRTPSAPNPLASKSCSAQALFLSSISSLRGALRCEVCAERFGWRLSYCHRRLPADLGLQSHVFNAVALREQRPQALQSCRPVIQRFHHDMRGQCDALGGERPDMQIVNRRYSVHCGHGYANLFQRQVQGPLSINQWNASRRTSFRLE